MEYHLLTYSLLFLPAVLFLYNLTPVKFRWVLLLIVNFVFYWMISGKLIIYFLLASVITYLTGLALEHVAANSSLKGKALTKKKRPVLAIGILLNLSMLIIFKYLKLVGINLIAPVGISYYTLQTISYMTDVHRKTIPADHNPGRLMLYLSFFPQVIEGPISRYSEVANDLYAGKGLEYKNITFGYQRILWGLFKKMIIADHLAPAVYKIFLHPEQYDGSSVAMGAIMFTVQLYAEFSGCMDIIIGSGETLGITLPENFRQPFFAKNASDFWRRWHITLGTWLKDYIFYPISLAKPIKDVTKSAKKKGHLGFSKMFGPTVSLFFVWLTNGIWHGAGWTYLFYGMYYFVLIFLEMLTEPSFEKFYVKHNINSDGKILTVLRAIKLFFIVNIGEMFFRATSMKQGFSMFKQILFDFHISKLPETNFGIDNYDMLLCFGAVILVFIVDVIHEKGISIREKIAGYRLPMRWAIWYAMIFGIIIMGAYGAGYTVMDMIYAAY